MNYIPNFFSETVQTCHLSTLRMPKVLKSTCRKVDVYLHAKNQLHISLLFWDIVKTWQTCYFANFGNAWLSPSKIIPSIYRKLSCLSACKKLTSSFTFSLRYYKDIANLLFWVLWACLAMHTHSDTINLKKNFTFINKQKICAKVCKLLILGTLGMPAYAHLKW